MKRILPVLFIFQSCIGAGDMFARRDKIIGKYYLVERENGTYTIGYDLDGLYESRSPEGVVAYGIKDSILVVKVKPFNSGTFYYAINTNKGEMARKEEYEMGSISANSYKYSWLSKLNLDFRSVK